MADIDTKLRRGFVDTAGGQIHFASAGSGEPLVLLPHSGRSTRMYRELMPLLAPHCRAIALDPPGSGESFCPKGSQSIPELAETLHEAADTLIGDRYMVYGMNGGNKLGAALAAEYPDAVSGLIFAGFTHSIILSNHRRDEFLGGKSSVRDILTGFDEADTTADTSSAWVTQARKAASFDPNTPFSQAIGEAIDRLQALRYRPRFYREVLAFNLEGALRALRAPLAVLEFCTAEEDAQIGRQGGTRRRGTRCGSPGRDRVTRRRTCVARRPTPRPRQ